MLTDITADTPKPLPQWRLSLPNRPLTGLTVLVIEDSRFASEAVRLLCLKSGARIRRADCLRSAARHLRSYRPAVVVIDLGLPDGDGGRANRGTARRRTAGAGDPGDVRRSRPRVRGAGGGADGFLPKPVESLAVFQQAILRVLPADTGAMTLRALPDDVIQPDPRACATTWPTWPRCCPAPMTRPEIDKSPASWPASPARRTTPRWRLRPRTCARLQRRHALRRIMARISGMVQDRLSRVAEM